MTIVVFVSSLLGAMALGMPIAFALVVCGVALMVYMGNFDTQILAQNMLEGVNNYPLMAVPFFMLAGELMNAGGISRRIIAMAEAVVGHVRGGLGYVAILAALVMAVPATFITTGTGWTFATLSGIRGAMTTRAAKRRVRVAMP